MKHCFFILAMAVLIAYLVAKAPHGKSSLSVVDSSKGCMQAGVYLQGSIEPLMGKHLSKDSVEIYLDTSSSFEFVSNLGKFFAKGAGDDMLSQMNRLGFQTLGFRGFDDSIKKGKRKVWILNHTSDSIAFPGNWDHFFIAVLEAKDREGKWKPIQYSLNPKPYFYTNIPPKSAGSFIAEMPDKGNFETQFRFKVLGKSEFHCSNEFKGRMNECEFVQDTSTYDRVNGVRHPSYKLEYTVADFE